MCGIAGIISTAQGVHEREAVVTKMMALLRHRGPDDNGIYSAETVTVGHQRLSIIDLEHGHQPMVSDDGRYILVFNGEIYNYLELRQQLVQKGVRFKTSSDTEVLLRILIHDRENALSKLNGMFAFAFFDTQTSYFMICRDRVGVKPMYYTTIGNGIAFASEIKALVRSGYVRAEVEHEYLDQYLTYQFCINEGTLFKNINKLQPGYYITGHHGKIESKTQYWDTNFEVDQYHNEDYFEDELLGLLHDSIKLQMRSDVPVGIYLSGGIDSSAIAVLACEILGGGLEAFHGRFAEGQAYDESNYAQLVARAAASSFNEVVPTMDDFIAEMPGLIYALDEPVAGPGSFPQLLVSRLASKKVKVILGGQGGDELFCGYARYLIGYLEQAIKGSIYETQEEGKHLVNLQTIIKSLPLLKQYTPLMKTFWQKGLFEEMDARYFRLIDRSPDLSELLTKEKIHSFDKGKVFESFRSIFNHPQTRSYINKMTHFDLKTLLPSLLQVEDRVSMASSIESRVPLLDHRVIDLVTTMPPSIKFNEGQTKYIFKKALRNKVPSEVIHRKDKMGFPVPLSEWITNKKFREFVTDTLESQKARQRGIFKQGITQRLLDQDVNFGRQLWGILSLEIWFQTFID